MSKRAEEAALKAYPPTFSSGKKDAKRIQAERVDTHQPMRTLFIRAYEQAEKETIERAMEWIKTHWREYIIGPDADGCICFGHWKNDFRKAMEEE